MLPKDLGKISRYFLQCGFKCSSVVLKIELFLISYALLFFKIKQKAGVDAIKFPPPGYVDFSKKPNLKLLVKDINLDVS